MIIRGDVRLIVPYRTPLVMGNEFSGTVVQVGAAAVKFKPGDRVYGRMPLAKIGAFAEYAAIDEGALALVPSYLSMEEAACVPLTALTALQALDIMEAQPGQTLFISGGTGSLGAMAIPIAARMGLTVATNGSARNEERVRNLGARVFLDYKTQRYVDELHDVDCVLDTLGERELPDEFSVLKPGGHLVSLRGVPNGRFAKREGLPTLKRALFGLAGRSSAGCPRRDQTYGFVFVHEDGAQLSRVAELFPAERPLAVSIDGNYELDQINDVLVRVRSGHSQGKTLLRVKQA
ncbi:MAG: NADP-dependent oxidoreductase [Atopobiaceae bacterium]|nr:NADP-dependent oxidoreductase [Atopobiaceae bacterium]